MKLRYDVNLAELHDAFSDGNIMMTSKGIQYVRYDSNLHFDLPPELTGEGTEITFFHIKSEVDSIKAYKKRDPKTSKVVRCLRVKAIYRALTPQGKDPYYVLYYYISMKDLRILFSSSIRRVRPMLDLSFSYELTDSDQDAPDPSLNILFFSNEVAGDGVVNLNKDNTSVVLNDDSLKNFQKRLTERKVNHQVFSFNVDPERNPESQVRPSMKKMRIETLKSRMKKLYHNSSVYWWEILNNSFLRILNSRDEIVEIPITSRTSVFVLEEDVKKSIDLYKKKNEL